MKDGSWALQPGLQRLSSFLSSQRQALLAVGLQRREKVIDPLEYIKEKFGVEGEPDK